MILGYDTADTRELIGRLSGCKKSSFSPFTLIKAFLYVERKRRFREVNDKITAFQAILQNYGRLPVGQDRSVKADHHRMMPGRDAGSRKNLKNESMRRTMRNPEDPKTLIRLYLDVCTLKNALSAWRAQLEDFKTHAGADFDDTNADIDPVEYMQRLIDEYKVKINKCDLVLQGASLAFQMVRATYLLMGRVC